MGRFKNPEQIKVDGLTYFAGYREIVLEGRIPHGPKATREVRLHLTPELLTYLARLAVYVVVEPDPEHHGHCKWHFENPEREYPCDQCSDAVKAAKEKWARRLDAPAPALPRRARP